MLFRLVAALAPLMVTQVALAQDGPPLPPRRPVEAPSPTTPPALLPEARPAASTASEPPVARGSDPCLASLTAAGYEIEPAEPPQVSNELCRIETPVRLMAVPVPSKSEAAVRLADQPLLACRFADRFGHWIGDLVAPLVVGIKHT